MTKPRRPRIDFDVRGVLDAIDQASVDALTKCALAVESEAKRSMRGGGGNLHEPSTPPAPPHVQTGTLRASITYAIERTARGFTALVGVPKTVWYGKIHEYGGMFAVKQHQRRKRKDLQEMITVSAHSRDVPERPFMRPALEMARAKFAGMFKNLKLAQTAAGRKLNRQKGRR